MTRLHRRRLLLGLLAAAVLPAIAAPEALAQAAGTAGAILPPPQPLIYTRRLERTLTGDARIVVERRFAVRFTPSATGFVVDGEQIAVTVETPAQLADLARLERERVEIGIFPLELDAAGRIRSGHDADLVPEIDAALRYVAETFATLDRSADEQRTLRDFIAAIHQAGSAIVSSLPADLFAPLAGDRSDQRTIDLPVGGRGLVSTRFSALRDPATGLMRRARRDVVTSIAEDERRTTEIFTLES